MNGEPSADHPGPSEGHDDSRGASPKAAVWRRPPILIGAGVAVVAAIVAVVLLAVAGKLSGPDPIIYEPGHNPFEEAEGPSCIGMPLGGGTVVYCVDSSSALRNSFDAIRASVDRSLGTLGIRQRFGLVVWTEDEPKVLPMAGNTPASREAAAALLEETLPSGSTDAKAGIQAAIALGPDALCIIAAKGPEEGDLSAVVGRAAQAGCVVRCLAIRDAIPTLSGLAERTGGSYQLIDPQQLRIWLTESE
ncbi:MAG: hypothetical protein JXQ73_08210 [Phycisphaerae bacterium]|nr:hypothetical protein [Phycisphaerae bacterium]